MVLAIQIFQIIFYSVAILFMVTLTILSIWGFVIFNKIYKNQRISNFLLDKINQSISNYTYSKYNFSVENSNDNDFNIDEFLNEDELFQNNKEDDKNSPDNIISF